jgi:hypothetical protein
MILSQIIVSPISRVAWCMFFSFRDYRSQYYHSTLDSWKRACNPRVNLCDLVQGEIEKKLSGASILCFRSGKLKVASSSQCRHAIQAFLREQTP